MVGSLFVIGLMLGSWQQQAVADEQLDIAAIMAPHCRLPIEDAAHQSQAPAVESIGALHAE
jgi:hypothetical protein